MPYRSYSTAGVDVSPGESHAAHNSREKERASALVWWPMPHASQGWFVQCEAENSNEPRIKTDSPPITPRRKTHGSTNCRPPSGILCVARMAGGDHRRTTAPWSHSCRRSRRCVRNHDGGVRPKEHGFGGISAGHGCVEPPHTMLPLLNHQSQDVQKPIRGKC
jgi:hypothetical protein